MRIARRTKPRYCLQLALKCQKLLNYQLHIFVTYELNFLKGIVKTCQAVMNYMAYFISS